MKHNSEQSKLNSLGRRSFLAGGIGTAALSLPTVGWGEQPLNRPPRLGKSVRQRIKVGQIGVGHAHASKLSVYRNSPDYEVVGIVEPDQRLRERAAKQKPYQGLEWMSQEQLLNQKDLQVVLVETHVKDLLDVAEKSIAAGKHIHLDKPAGESFQQFDRILKDAERQNLMVQMGYMYRYNPAVKLLRKMLKDGWLGDPFELHTVMSKVVSPSARKSLARYRGGMLFELGCHILDLTIGILGSPEKVSSVNLHSSPADDQLIDNMLAVLTYPKAIATVKSTAQEVNGFSRRHLVVCGTEGTFHIQPLDNPSAQVALSRKRGTYPAGNQTITFPRYTRYVDDAADMAKVIRGEKPNDYSYDHDRAVQRTLLTACQIPLDQ